MELIMSTLRDQVIKLAYNNPGPVRDALLPILKKAKTAARGKWLALQQLPESSIGIPMDRKEAILGWQGFIKESLILLGRKHPAYKYKVKLSQEGSNKYKAYISAYPAKFDEDEARGVLYTLRGEDETALEATLWIEDGKFEWGGPGLNINMVENFGRPALVSVHGYTGRGRHQFEWQNEFPDAHKAWRWVD